MNFLDNMPDILKNSIVLSLLSFVIVYGYLYWEESEKAKKRKNKKMKKVSIFIPGIIGALVWFGASNYFDKEITEENVNLDNNINEHNTKTNLLSNKKIYSEEKKYSEDNNYFGEGGYRMDDKYRYSKKGRIELPNEDVFLNLADF